MIANELLKKQKKKDPTAIAKEYIQYRIYKVLHYMNKTQ